MTKTTILKRASLIFLAFFLLIFWQMPAPSGMSDQAWHIFIIFITTILGIMFNALPLGVISLIALTLCMMTKLLTVDKALSGFGSPIVWLVVMAFFIARALIKSGLGARVAYYLISKFGSSTLGLSYSIILTELFLAPAIPSASARGGGIMFPVVQSVIDGYRRARNTEIGVDSLNDSHKENKIGKFLIMLCFHTNVITSAMFLTAIASNPIVVKLAASYGVHIDWVNWAIGAIVPGLISLLALPVILYILCKPTVVNGHEIVIAAKETLRAMGSLKTSEIFTFIIFLALIAMWIFEHYLSLNATTAAMIGLSALLLTKVLNWNDVVKEQGAWDTFIWFSILVVLAGALNDLGTTKWMVSKIELLYKHNNMGKFSLLTILCLFFFYIHYFFASVTVHITVMYAIFLGIFIDIGLPPLPSALSLAFLSVLSASLTHYGIGSAPIFFGAGHVSIPYWWRISAIVAIINLSIWVIVCGIWWKALGWI
ncbi:putative malate transporter YflS [Alphaproteobacteria bacterium]